MLYYSQIDLETEETLLVMQDLALTMRIHPAEYRFTPAETLAILDCYIRLHTAGIRQAGLQPGGASRLVTRWGWLQEEAGHVDSSTAHRIIASLLASPLTGPRLWEKRKVLESLASQVDALLVELDQMPQTFCYCDFFPGNIAVPVEPSPGEPAILFDWHLLGVGTPQSDLLNVFWVDHLDEEKLRPFFDYYLRGLNANLDCRFDLDWIHAGLNLARKSAFWYSLWLLAQRLPGYEQPGSKLPAYLDETLCTIESMPDGG